jgi:hypothetical protein
MGLGFNIGMDIHGEKKEWRFRLEQNLDCEESGLRQRKECSISLPPKGFKSKD